MIKFKDLQVNGILSETTFYKVQKIVGDKAELITNDGQEVTVDKKYIENILISGDQFETEQKVTRTELTDIILKASGVAITANFNKQIKEVDVVKEIMETYQNSTPKTMETAVKKAVKKGLEGEPRTLRGFHYGSQDEYGRLVIYDMDITKDTSKSYNTQSRLLDTRGLNWAIIRNIKYTVK